MERQNDRDMVTHYAVASDFQVRGIGDVVATIHGGLFIS